MSAPLDSRVVRILRWLLAQTEPRSTAELANDLVLSERAVRYRLSAVQNFLHSHGGELHRQRGTGLSISLDDEARAVIMTDLDARTTAPRVYAPEEREHLLLDALLWNHPGTISLDRLNEELEVSKTSARRDLRRCEPWLERMGLPVVRKPGQGLLLHGSEQAVRRSMVQLILESVPSDVLDELCTRPLADANLLRVRVPAGLRDRLSELPIQASAEALRGSPLRDRLASGNSDLVYTLYLAITVARVAAGRPIELEPGQFLSLRDHPVSDTVRSLAKHLAGAGQPQLSDEEIAGLGEYLLGFDALAEDVKVSTDVEDLVGEILAIASKRLHASLADDDELRRSLAMHLSRLTIRLRYGLPVHNPLRVEVAARYPEVQAVAEELSEMLSGHFGSTLQADEIGFITMYLSGAMERGHLHPRKKAMVVCPSGMATAWVLVSRLQAEFPELALAEVLSAHVYEERDTSEFDLVISTVPLDEAGAPVIVVSPLLSSANVRTIAQSM